MLNRRDLIAGGVFHCRLTPDEANELFVLLNSSQCWLALKAAECRRDAGIHSGEFVEVLSSDSGEFVEFLSSDLLRCRQAVFEFIQEWHERVVRPRLEADPIERWAVGTKGEND